MATITVNHRYHDVPAKLLQRIVSEWIVHCDDCSSVEDAVKAGKLEDFISDALDNPIEFVRVEGGMYGHVILKGAWHPGRWSYAICGTIGHTWRPATETTRDLCPRCQEWVAENETEA